MPGVKDGSIKSDWISAFINGAHSADGGRGWEIRGGSADSRSSFSCERAHGQAGGWSSVFSPRETVRGRSGKLSSAAKTGDDQLSSQVFRSRLTPRPRSLSGLSDRPSDRWRLKSKKKKKKWKKSRREPPSAPRVVNPFSSRFLEDRLARASTGRTSIREKRGLIE